GALSPVELIAKAQSVGLSAISITDHDTVNAIEEAVTLGRDHSVDVIPGIELSATFNGSEIHILGYFVDVHNEALLESLATFREERLKRVERIVDKLNRMNIPLTMESVLAKAGNGAIGRPHVANALVNEGHAASFQQAFNKYIGEGRPAYEKKSPVTPAETVRLIAQAGGLSFLAHPGRSVDEATLTHLIKSGLDGIEVIHPSHSPEVVNYYRGIVEEYYLLESGGSDFHGGLKNDDQQFGHVCTTLATVDVMRHRLFSQ
ncbi:MAG TPA: PHP domain-containing protein, partial [Bacteroidota bacterium]|nr:PHP domain-containing protein [Bacteroidota bacterium]